MIVTFKESLTEFEISHLEDDRSCNNKAETNHKCKAKAGICISFYVGSYDAAQPSDVDHPIR
jgi:hypothetical protein